LLIRPVLAVGEPAVQQEEEYVPRHGGPGAFNFIRVKYFFLGVLAVVGYYLWSSLVVPEPEPAPLQEAPEPAPTPVDFAVKMRVQRILDEWKRQSLALEAQRKSASMLDLDAEINEIRRRLYDNGLHDAKSLEQIMVQAAVELGYAPDQARLLVGEVLGAR